MRVRIGFGTAGTKSLQVTDDSTLAAVAALNCSVAVSSDPNLVYADVTTGATASRDYAFLVHANAGRMESLAGLSAMEIKSGETIYVSTSGVGSAVIYLEPILS